MRGLHWAPFCLFVASIFGTETHGCTILSFTNHSFSANVVRLLHSLPIFDGHNGTVYLDSTASSHKCHADGGLHEFLTLGKHAVPWTAEAEAAEASRCARYSLGDIDNMVHETGIAWEWLVEVSLRRIWKYQPWLRTMLLGVLQGLQATEKPIIAIHVKAHGTTPVQKHLAIPPQEYLDLFVKSFPHVKGGTCIVAGGNEAQNEETQALAAQTIGCKPFNRTELHIQDGDPQKVSHASWKAHCLLTRNLLIDLELLAHADYFVGTSKSGLTPIIEAMRHVLYGKDRRTFITHGGDWFERIREYFREHHAVRPMSRILDNTMLDLRVDSSEKLPIVPAIPVTCVLPSEE